MFKPYKYVKEEYTEEKKPAFNKVDEAFSRMLSLIPDRSSRVALSLKTIISTSLILFGSYLMISKVIIPAYVIHAASGEAQPIISPLAEDASMNLSVEGHDSNFTFEELETELQISRNANDNPDYFYLTVPKLDIESALVEINSNNLDPKEAIGHYVGSCLPNEACNSFVFGHSTYKWKKNKYKEGDYTGIFSELNKLEYGDEFYINYKGKEYRYIVELTKVASPDEINPLGSPLPRSIGEHTNTVELFTCTPSGTTKYRLSVVGKLVE